jgi:hypothetical protein
VRPGYPVGMYVCYADNEYNEIFEGAEYVLEWARYDALKYCEDSIAYDCRIVYCERVGLFGRIIR